MKQKLNGLQLVGIALMTIGSGMVLYGLYTLYTAGVLLWERLQ